VYPNPLSQSATIAFSLSQPTPVVISIMDANGKVLQIVADENFLEGSYEVIFNRGSLIAGIYFLQVKMSQGVMMYKMVID
jgi:hypothetical protein